MAYSVPLVFSQVCALIPAVIQGKVGFNPNNYIIKEGVNGIPANEMSENFLSDELVAIADKYADIAIWISVASGALMLVMLCFYGLSKKKHAEIVAALKLESVNAVSIEEEKGNMKFFSDEESEAAENSAVASGENPDTDVVDNANEDKDENEKEQP